MRRTRREEGRRGRKCKRARWERQGPRGFLVGVDSINHLLLNRLALKIGNGMVVHSERERCEGHGQEQHHENERAVAAGHFHRF
jgi:hypothetical protein